MAARLEGKVALVTGSTSNIGRGVAIAMAAAIAIQVKVDREDLLAWWDEGLVTCGG